MIEANREIGVAFSPTWISYHEYDPHGKVLDGDHGGVPGISIKASLIHHAAGLQNVFAQVTYQINTGQTHHVNASGLNYQSAYSTNDLNIEIGKGFLVRPTLLVIPVVQFNYHEWFRSLPKAALSVQETYTFNAPGIALRGSYALSPSVVISGKGGVEHMVSANNAGVGNPFNFGGVPDVNMTLGDRPVWQAEMGADWLVGRATHINVVTDYMHFPFGQSPHYYFDNNQHGQYEPPSRTNLGRLTIGFAWSY